MAVTPLVLLVVMWTLAEAARDQVRLGVELELAGDRQTDSRAGLAPNQFISSFYNRLMRSPRSEIMRYQWFAPVGCGLKTYWLNVTNSMVAQKVSNPCILVTCPVEGNMQAQLLDACPDRYRKVVNHESFSTEAPRGLRLVTTSDPMVLDGSGNLVPLMSKYQNVFVKAADLERSSDHGLKQLKDFPLLGYMEVKAWDLTVDAMACSRQVQPGGMPVVRDSATSAQCAAAAQQQKAACGAAVDRRLQAGIDGYLKDPKRGEDDAGAIDICDQLKTQGVSAHIMQALGGSKALTKEDCRKAFNARVESDREACGVAAAQYCQRAEVCLQQAALPRPDRRA